MTGPVSGDHRNEEGKGPIGSPKARSSSLVSVDLRVGACALQALTPVSRPRLPSEETSPTASPDSSPGSTSPILTSRSHSPASAKEEEAHVKLSSSIESKLSSALSPLFDITDQGTNTGPLNYSSFIKLPLEVLNFASSGAEWIKNMFVKPYETFFSSKSVKLVESGAILAAEMCQTLKSVDNLGTTFNAKLSMPNVDVVSTVGTSLQGVTNTIRGVFSIVNFSKVYSFRKEIGLNGRVTDQGKQIEALKKRLTLDDKKVFSSQNLTGITDQKFVAKFNDYFTKSLTANTPEIVALQDELNFPLENTQEKRLEFANMLNDEAYITFFKETFKIEDQTISALRNDPQAVIGFVLCKRDLVAKTQQDLIHMIAKESEDSSKITKMFDQNLRVTNICKRTIGEPEPTPEATKKLLDTLKFTANRQLLKQAMIGVSCALMIAGSIATLFFPPAAGAVLAFWIISNVIQFGISLRGYSVASKENEEALKGKKINPAYKFETILNMAINVAVIGLVIALACTPPGAAIGSLVLITSAVTAGSILIFNACMFNQTLRKKVIDGADFIDRTANRFFAKNIFGLDIIEPKVKQRTSLASQPDVTFVDWDPNTFVDSSPISPKVKMA